VGIFLVAAEPASELSEPITGGTNMTEVRSPIPGVKTLSWDDMHVPWYLRTRKVCGVFTRYTSKPVPVKGESAYEPFCEGRLVGT